MRTRTEPATGHRWWATVVGVLVGVGVVAALTWAALVPHGLRELEYRNLGAALAFGLTGAFLLWRGVGTRIAAILGAQGLVAAVTAWAWVYQLWRPDGHLAPGAGTVLLLHDSIWIVLVALVVPLALLFPDGRLAHRRARWLIVATALCVLLYEPGAFTHARAFQLVSTLTISGVFVGMVLAAGSVVLRRRAATGVARAQLSWFLFGLLLVAVFFFFTPESKTVWADLVDLVSLLPLPVAIGVAVVRYRLFEIGRIVSRTVAYVVVLAVLGGVFVAVVLFATVLLPAAYNSLAVAVATLAVAAIAMPLLRRVKRLVDRRFNRERYDAGLLVERFAASVREEADDAAIRSELLAVVGRTVQPVHASLWTFTTGT